MPPKPPPPPKETLEKEQDILQAVVLADSYNQRFQPLTVDRPRCLLPLCNVPLLEWTLESLAVAGVQEVIVFCTTQAEMVQAALQSSCFSRPYSPLTITTVVSPSALSVGDALRELHDRKLIKSDFILLSGDVVSNLNLMEAVEAHRERRKVSKDAIMTMVVKEGGLGRKIRPIPTSSLFVLSPTNKLLHYEPVAAVPRKKRAHLPGSIFDPKWGEEEVEVRNDLIDCGIDVCSVDIPELFFENFDYQSIRLDFLPGILTSDLTNQTLHVHFAGQGYAARVSDTLSYDAVSRDVLSRWTYPMVPDGNLPGGTEGEERYELREGGVYVTRSTKLSRTCHIGPNTLIGPRSIISDAVALSTSVIGRNVSIHPSCTIVDSYIWDDAVIEAGCTISASIIGKGVRVGKGSTIGKGCLIGDGVRVGEGVKLEDFSRVGRRKWREEDDEDESSEEEDEEEEDQASRIASLGKGSIGFLWPSDSLVEEEDSDAESTLSDSENPFEHPPNKLLLQLARTTSHLALSDSSGSLSILSRESTPESSPASALSASSAAHLGRPTNLSLALEDQGDEPGFRIECVATLDHAFEKGGAVDEESIDFAALQIKSARATTNVGPGIVREVVLGYLIEKVDAFEVVMAIGPVRMAAIKLFDKWGPLVGRFSETQPEKIEVLQYLQQYILAHPLSADHFQSFLVALYNSDVVEADDLLAWFVHPDSKVDPDDDEGKEMANLLDTARKFVEQAVENEQESESGSEEESSDED